MNGSASNLPESWLSRLGGMDASGWLTAFQSDAVKAVADLLWNRFYFGPLNLIERGQLLAGWLEALGNDLNFASHLDTRCAEWVEANWGRFEQDGIAQASAWMCLSSVVEFSARLNPSSHLTKTAEALWARFEERKLFLGSFSTAPAEDPLGFYLAAIAEFQGEDRSLAGFWHRLCDLPDGVPIYHARYAMLGLRRLKAATAFENGSLRAEVVLGLLRLANAFDRKVRGRGLPESVAKSTFRRVAAQLAAAYPDSPRWSEHGLASLMEMSERPRRWVLEGVPSLAGAFRLEQAQANWPHTRPRRSVEPDRSWASQARELAGALKNGATDRISDINRLLDEQRRYADTTGDTYFVVRSLCNFASQILTLRQDFAGKWAEEARQREPHNPFTWCTIKEVLLKQRNRDRALRFSWVAWRRFPENVVVRSGLAEVLKAMERYAEAEEVYRQSIAHFPENVVVRSGLAEVLKAMGRYAEAEEVYRQSIAHFPEDVVARNGLADTLRRDRRWEEAETAYRDSLAAGHADCATYVGLAYLLLRQGEAEKAEALSLLDQALLIDSGDSYVLALKQKLVPAQGVALEAIAEAWDEVADELLPSPSVAEDDDETKAEAEVVAEGSGGLTGLESAFAPVAHPMTPPVGKPTASANPPLVRVRRQPQVDLLEVAALLAEASFFRGWASRSSPEAAVQRREKAAALLARAERLAPADAQVVAERAALESAQVGSKTAATHLTLELGKYPGSAPLLVLKARLDREEARRSQRGLSDEALADLLQAPRRLRDLDAAFTPIFHMQKGLAALALLDGAVRMEKAAEGFTIFRQTLSRRADEERSDREASRDARARKTPRFHEWLQRTVNDRLFSGFSGPEAVRPQEVPALERSFVENPFLFEEIEDAVVGHLAFAGV